MSRDKIEKESPPSPGRLASRVGGLLKPKPKKAEAGSPTDGEEKKLDVNVPLYRRYATTAANAFRTKTKSRQGSREGSAAPLEEQPSIDTAAAGTQVGSEKVVADSAEDKAEQPISHAESVIQEVLSDAQEPTLADVAETSKTTGEDAAEASMTPEQVREANEPTATEEKPSAAEQPLRSSEEAKEQTQEKSLVAEQPKAEEPPAIPKQSKEAPEGTEEVQLAEEQPPTEQPSASDTTPRTLARRLSNRAGNILKRRSKVVEEAPAKSESEPPSSSSDGPAPPVSKASLLARGLTNRAADLFTSSGKANEGESQTEAQSEQPSATADRAARLARRLSNRAINVFKTKPKVEDPTAAGEASAEVAANNDTVEQAPTSAEERAVAKQTQGTVGDEKPHVDSDHDKPLPQPPIPLSRKLSSRVGDIFKGKSKPTEDRAAEGEAVITKVDDATASSSPKPTLVERFSTSVRVGDLFKSKFAKAGKSEELHASGESKPAEEVPVPVETKPEATAEEPPTSTEIKPVGSAEETAAPTEIKAVDIEEIASPVETIPTETAAETTEDVELKAKEDATEKIEATSAADSEEKQVAPVEGTSTIVDDDKPNGVENDAEGTAESVSGEEGLGKEASIKTATFARRLSARVVDLVNPKPNADSESVKELASPTVEDVPPAVPEKDASPLVQAKEETAKGDPIVAESATAPTSQEQAETPAEGATQLEVAQEVPNFPVSAQSGHEAPKGSEEAKAPSSFTAAKVEQLRRRVSSRVGSILHSIGKTEEKAPPIPSKDYQPESSAAETPVPPVSQVDEETTTTVAEQQPNHPSTSTAAETRPSADSTTHQPLLEGIQKRSRKLSTHIGNLFKPPKVKREAEKADEKAPAATEGTTEPESSATEEAQEKADEDSTGEAAVESNEAVEGHEKEDDDEDDGAKNKPLPSPPPRSTRAKVAAFDAGRQLSIRAGGLLKPKPRLEDLMPPAPAPVAEATVPNEAPVEGAGEEVATAVPRRPTKKASELGHRLSVRVNEIFTVKPKVPEAPPIPPKDDKAPAATEDRPVEPTLAEDEGKPQEQIEEALVEASTSTPAPEAKEPSGEATASRPLAVRVTELLNKAKHKFPEALNPKASDSEHPAADRAAAEEKAGDGAKESQEVQGEGSTHATKRRARLSLNFRSKKAPKKEKEVPPQLPQKEKPLPDVLPAVPPKDAVRVSSEVPAMEDAGQQKDEDAVLDTVVMAEEETPVEEVEVPENPDGPPIEESKVDVEEKVLPNETDMPSIPLEDEAKPLDKDAVVASEAPLSEATGSKLAEEPKLDSVQASMPVQ